MRFSAALLVAVSLLSWSCATDLGPRRFHDDERQVTCWAANGSMSCLPDRSLVPSVATPIPRVPAAPVRAPPVEL